MFRQVYIQPVKDFYKMKNMHLLFILLICGFRVVSGDIMVYTQETHHQIEVEFRDMSSTFGPPILPQGIKVGFL